MADLRQLAERLRTQIEQQRPDCAPDVMHEPAAVYTCTARFQRERSELFRRYPVFAAWSAELGEPGSFLTVNVDDVSVLLTRDKNGEVHAFRNSCRHRGMPLTRKANGCATRFTCPFHGWTYDNTGQLFGINQRQYFPGIDKSTHSLLPIAVAEKHGLIFVRVEGTGPIDLDAHLAGLGEEFAGFGWTQWKVALRNELCMDVNWKLIVDGFCEGYHFSFLHPNTLGAIVIPNTQLVDLYGPHVREAFANQGIKEYFESSRNDDPPKLGGDVALIYIMCPNLLLIGLNDLGWQAISIWHDGAVGKTIVKQTVIVSPEASKEEFQHCVDHASHIWHKIIVAEDFPISQDIWSALKGGNLPNLALGRNEWPLQHMHRQYNQLAGA